MTRRPLRGLLSLALLALAVAATAAAGEAPADTALEHPAVREVVEMSRAELGPAVILARVDQLGAFPELDATALVALKKAGVPEPVLLRMIELADGQDSRSGAGPADVATATPAPTPPPVHVVAAADTAPADPDVDAATGTIRVLAGADFPVSYVEVVVDGELASSRGRLWEGEGDPGIPLRRPPSFDLDPAQPLLEIPVEPGVHEVAVGFAVSTVESDPDDQWSEYAREAYRTRGVRALGEPLPGQRDADPTAATCAVAAGQVCEVVATPHAEPPGALGGLPVYGVSSTVRHLP